MSVRSATRLIRCRPSIAYGPDALIPVDVGHRLARYRSRELEGKLLVISKVSERDCWGSEVPSLAETAE